EAPAQEKAKLPVNRNSGYDLSLNQWAECEESQQICIETQISQGSPTCSYQRWGEETAVGPGDNYTAPATSVEKIIAGIWSEVLGISLIGIHDNFFELGGHSILATRVLSQINQSFQVELPTLSMYESPTVAELAECIEAVYKMEQGSAALLSRGSSSQK